MHVYIKNAKLKITNYNFTAKLPCQNKTLYIYVQYNQNIISLIIIFFYRDLLHDSPGFGVPHVIEDLSTKRVLTTELIHGIPLDQCVSLDQHIKNDVMIVLLLHSLVITISNLISFPIFSYLIICVSV